MSIADRIAAEHEWAPFWCKCGTAVHDANHLTTRKMRDLHTRHVAAMTEAAVRAQVAADIEVKRAEAALAATAYREAGDESAAWEAAMSAHAYGYAARIAEGGHQ